jgi:hypothetical protein
VALCDMCSAEMRLDQGTAYTSAELEGMVARGFEPPEPILRKALAAGLSREQILARWKWGLSQKSTWLLCPDCAARAAEYRPRPVGVRLAEQPRWTPSGARPAATATPVVETPRDRVAAPGLLSRAAPAGQQSARMWRPEKRPARRRRVPVLLIGLVVIIVLLLIAPFLDGGAFSSTPAKPSPTPSTPTEGPASSMVFPIPYACKSRPHPCEPLVATVTKSPDCVVSKGSSFQLP